MSFADLVAMKDYIAKEKPLCKSMHMKRRVENVEFDIEREINKRLRTVIAQANENLQPQS
jgi:hypothetical protein